MVKKVEKEIEVNDVVEKPKHICLNLGCGFRKMGDPDNYWINIDNRPECEPNMLLDIIQGLPFENNSVDEVRAFDFLEHIPIGKTVQVIEEIYRVLKPSGKFESFTPSTDGRGWAQDPFHISFWNTNSFLYYCDDDHRNLYGIKAKFSGSINTIVTNKQLNILHVHAILYAEK